jgi:hypothetical protein
VRPVPNLAGPSMLTLHLDSIHSILQPILTAAVAAAAVRTAAAVPRQTETGYLPWHPCAVQVQAVVH